MLKKIYQVENNYHNKTNGCTKNVIWVKKGLLNKKLWNLRPPIKLNRKINKEIAYLIHDQRIAACHIYILTDAGTGDCDDTASLFGSLNLHEGIASRLQTGKGVRINGDA